MRRRSREYDERAFEELLKASEQMMREVDRLGDDIPLSLKSAWGALGLALRVYGRGPKFERPQDEDEFDRDSWTDPHGRVFRLLDDWKNAVPYRDLQGHIWHWNGGLTTTDAYPDMEPMFSRTDFSVVDVPMSEISPGPITSACDAYQTWNGQEMPCERCAQPAWEHEHVSTGYASPFGDEGEVTERWTGLMAEAHLRWRDGGTVKVMRGESEGTWMLSMEGGPDTERIPDERG